MSSLYLQFSSAQSWSNIHVTTLLLFSKKCLKVSYFCAVQTYQILVQKLSKISKYDIKQSVQFSLINIFLAQRPPKLVFDQSLISCEGSIFNIYDALPCCISCIWSTDLDQGSHDFDAAKVKLYACVHILHLHYVSLSFICIIVLYRLSISYRSALCICFIYLYHITVFWICVIYLYYLTVFCTCIWKTSPLCLNQIKSNLNDLWLVHQ